MSAEPLYERDFYTWTQQQAAALRRIAKRRGEPLDPDLDLENLIEEVADLGGEMVLRVQTLLGQCLQHLAQAANAPKGTAARDWQSQAVGFQSDAAQRFSPSMQKLVQPRLEREWRNAVQVAEQTLKRKLPHLAGPCPFTLERLLDEDAELAPLLTRLAPPTGG